MASYGAELPEGAILDEPVKSYGAELPEGAILDEPTTVQDITPNGNSVLALVEQPSQDTAQFAEQESRIMQKISSGANFTDQQKNAIAELKNRGRLSTPELPEILPEINPLIVGKETDLPLSEALATGAKNLPKSALKQVSSIWEAISKPGQTWEGVKSLSKDIYKNQMTVALEDMGFDPAKIKFEEGSLLDHIEKTPALDIVVDELQKTYGSYEGFKEAVSKDPARILMDIGTIAAPAAKGVEAAAMASKLPGVAKVAGAVSKGAALTEPITAATAGAKQALSGVSKLTGQAFKSLTPTGLYKSATKMSTVLSEAERTHLADVALEAGIMPTIKGLEKIDGKITKIDETIAGMIDETNLTGNQMPLGELFKEFKDLKSKRTLSASGLKDARAIDRVRKEILKANAKIKRGKLTPKETQQLKQTIYKDISNHYNKMKNSSANISAQKAVARGAKKYLESILPEIKNLNKADADLINLKNALDRPVSRIANRDIIGLGMASKAGGGGVVGGMVGGPEVAAAAAASGVIFGILDDPIVKSKIAIVLDKLQKQGVDIPNDRAIKRLLAEQVLEKTPTETHGEQ